MTAHDLHAAILADDRAAAEAALAAGAPLTAPTPPLVTATHRSAQAMIEVLLAHGADPNDAGDYDLAPLHVVRDATAVKRLVAAGADLEQRSAGGTPLHMAAANGTPAVIKALLAAGADPNATHDPWAQTPLFVAVRLRRTAAVKALLAHPPSPGAVARAVVEVLPRPSGDHMPKRKAKDAKTLDTILAARPNLDGIIPSTQLRLVHLLADRADEALAAAILAAGADPDARGPDDLTGVLHAARRASTGSERAAGVARAFVAAGADLDVVCTAGADRTTARALLSRL